MYILFVVRGFSEDLLETAASIRNPNMTRIGLERSMGMLKIALVTPTLSDLIRR